MAKSKTRKLQWGDGYISMVTLKSGVKKAQARWREPDAIRGSIQRSRNFDTWDQAADFLRENGRARRDGTYEAESQITLSEAVTEFCNTRLEQKKWKSNTYSTNKIFQEKLIDPQLGKKRVTRLRPKEIQTWADQLSKQKAASTVSSTLSIVRGALKRMVLLGVIPLNPAEPVEVRERTKGEEDAWTLEEVQEILDATRDDPMWHAFYLLGFNTGMRPGELRALRWSDITWEANLVTCARTITKDENGREVVGTTTKTGKPRSLVIGEAVAEALKRWKAIQNEHRLMQGNWQDTMVFDRGDGRFIPGTTLISKHDKLFANLKAPRYRPHAMRHTYATLEDEIGASPGVTRARLGHASEAMRMRYTHAQINAQKAAAERVAQLLLGESSDTTTSDEVVEI